MSKPLTIEQLGLLHDAASETPQGTINVAEKYFAPVREYVALVAEMGLGRPDTDRLLGEIRVCHSAFEHTMRDEYSKPSVDFYRERGVVHPKFEDWLSQRDNDEDICASFATKNVSSLLSSLGKTRRNYKGLADGEIVQALYNEPTSAPLVQRWMNGHWPQESEVFVNKLYQKDAYEKWLDMYFQVKDHRALVERLADTFTHAVVADALVNRSTPPKATIVMGFPGVGKSLWIKRRNLGYLLFGSQPVLLDPDWFSQFVPGYVGGLGSNNVLAWTKVIQARLVDDIVTQAIRPHVDIPMVGLLPRQAQKEIDWFRGLGYDVEVVYLHSADPNLGMLCRSLEDGGRVLPPYPNGVQADDLLESFLSLVQNNQGVVFTAVEGNKAKMPNGRLLDVVLPERLRATNGVRVLDFPLEPQLTV